MNVIVVHKAFLVLVLFINLLEVTGSWHLFIYFGTDLGHESLCFESVEELDIIIVILLPDDRDVALNILLIILIDFLDTLLYLMSTQRTRGVVTLVLLVGIIIFQMRLDLRSNHIKIILGVS